VPGYLEYGGNKKRGDLSTIPDIIGWTKSNKLLGSKITN
jgi:hypothetical protein